MKRLIGLFIICSLGCASSQPKPAEVATAVVDCSTSICNQVRAEPCTQLVSAVLTCLTSDGNTTVCMAGIPALVQVGYADVVCVVDALDLQTLPEAASNADAWFRSQRVEILK